jgi:hypothetical protein
MSIGGNGDAASTTTRSRWRCVSSEPLVRLYGLPVSRIVELTADRFHHHHGAAFLTMGKNPVLLTELRAASSS